MHGFRSGSTILLNAEVDSMGGVIDGGVGIGSKTSPRRAAIEKAQAELRLEYDVREERRRELEFLEKGGNPLDFKFVQAASISVHSTSFTDRLADQLVTSEAKGSFALTASPHGDSVESSGRLGMAVACEFNSADNFDSENQLHESKRKSKHPGNTITPSEHSSQLDGSQNAKESEDSPISLPKRGQAYRRRNRSRTNRDVARSSSTDIVSRGDQNSLLSGRNSAISKTINSDDQMNLGLEAAHAIDSFTNSVKISFLDEKIEPAANIDIADPQCTGNMKANGSSLNAASEGPDYARGNYLGVPEGTKSQPDGAEKVENHSSPGEINDSSKLKAEEKCTKTDCVMDRVGFIAKGLDSESSCTQTSLSVDGNGIIGSILCNAKHVNSNGASRGEKLALDEMQNSKDDTIFEGKQYPVVQSHQHNGFTDEDEKEMHSNRSSLQKEASSSYMEEMKSADLAEPKSYTEDAVDAPNSNLPSSSHEKLQGSMDSCNIAVAPVVSGPRPLPELPTPCQNQLKACDKAQEERILAEAQIIEAKHKRIAELSARSMPAEYHKKSHWDFVVEEMAWLANDFAQERLWKITAAAQICRRAAFASCSRSEEKDKHGKLRTIARTLANAVMEFWRLAELPLQADGLRSGLESRKYDAVASGKTDDIELIKGRIRCPDEEVDEDAKVEPKICERTLVLPIRGYAIRYLQYNNSVTPIVRAEVSKISDLASDVTMLDLSWEDRLTEENLFYIVPPGSVETYRKSIESYLVCSEKKGNKQQDDTETSMYDAAAEFESQENEFEEDEGESVYYLPGQFEGSRSLKIVQKKRKNIKSYGARSCEFDGYGNCIENRVGAAQSGLLVRSSINSLNVGHIPTKRIRTASRQRAVGAFSMVAGGVSTSTRTDASSGDTNSLQDDQSMLHSGSTTQKGSEVESGMAFDKQLIFDQVEVSLKPKKKKKPKHQAIAYDRKWALESVQNEQRDHLKKRSESNHYDSNGTSGLLMHQAKKQKLMKQSLDNSFGNMIPMSGTVASPAASQMSNMSNPNKLTKFIVGRDQARKTRLAKVPVHKPGCGSEWTLYEDQALVVLVHDMGPNWELVSDTFNTTLLFKGVFRRSSECKERHKALMDGPSGDGADSAEDSGSSQPYQSTLPGIPKGSARLLFQQLQEPQEEDTIKSHFEKIVLLGPRLPNRRKQMDNRDLKQIAPVHGSHIAALSQVFPNNVKGTVLTPLDLCDAFASSPDVFPLVCQPSASLASPNQGVIPPILPPGRNASLQNSPSMGIGSNLTTAAHPNGSVREGRYNVPRTTSLTNDEQQRVQQYNQVPRNRSMQPSNLSVPGAFTAAERNMRMLPGSGVGMMPGMNRSMAMRQGFQGIASSSMLNSGTTLGMPSTAKNSGSSPGQGNSMLKPRDTMHMARPNQSVEHQCHMMLPEMQLQVTQSNTQGVPQSVSVPVQTFPVHHQQQHPVPPHSNTLPNPHHPLLQGSTHPSAEQQAYLRAARQQQQRMLHRQHQHQQQQFPASNALMAHVQTQSHLPPSSPLQNNSQMQSPASSQPVSLPALTPSTPMTPTLQQQHKNQLPSHGLGRNLQSGVGGGMNQVGKQQHRQSTQPHQHQQLQQSGRHHPHQRLQSQSVQQAKRLNGVGRGNILMHQNLPLDSSHPNGLSGSQVNQAIEKGEQPMHLMQGHSMYSGPKPLVPPQPSGQTQRQQKPSSSSAPMSTKQVQQMPVHPEDINQTQAPAVPSAVVVPASTQGLPPSAVPSHSQNFPGRHQPPVKLVNQSQAAVQRSIQQSHQPTSDLLAKSQDEECQQEQSLVNNASPLGATSETSTACIESLNTVTVPSSSGSASVVSNSSQIGSIGSPLIPFSSGSEPLAAGIQGMGCGPVPDNLSPPVASIGTQWQQQQPSIRPRASVPAVLLQKQPQQQLEQKPQTQLSQEQIQSGQSSVLMRPANSRLE
ncbi:hypothetical protein Dimus_016624 [Dionaea muscipula]